MKKAILIIALLISIKTFCQSEQPKTEAKFKFYVTNPKLQTAIETKLNKVLAISVLRVNNTLVMVYTFSKSNEGDLIKFVTAEGQRQELLTSINIQETIKAERAKARQARH